MNFKYAPRLRRLGEIRRWTLHEDDYFPLMLQDVCFNCSNQLRKDLFYVDCTTMPRCILDEMEERLKKLWKALEWANEQSYAKFINFFSTGERVAVYNSKNLSLPREGKNRVRLSVQGIHSDLRLGMNFTAILIIEEVVSFRPPRILAGCKKMVLPEPDEEEEEEEEEEEDDDDEEEVEPAVKRVRFSPEFSDEPSQWNNEVEESRENSQVDIAVTRAQWIDTWLESVESPEAPIILAAPEEPIQIPHPCLKDANSRDKWEKATETYRMQYYRCPRHGGYLCPDCNLHVPNWGTFVTEHYGCSAFSSLSKSVICDIST